MASIRKEFHVRASADSVWDAVRDVGAVHERLVPGLVTSVEMQDGARTVTFSNGLVVNELIVDVDDEARRLAYASKGGRLAHHNASMQVFPHTAQSSRVVWITDLLPDEFAGQIAALMDKGAEIAAEHLSA